MSSEFLLAVLGHVARIQAFIKVEKMSLLISTPAYAGMVHVDYVHSLLQFRKEGISFDLWSAGNESLITRARNRAVSYFYENREKYTHLMYLDADIRLPADGLRELLSYGKDVIGAAVPTSTFVTRNIEA